jgi:alcohol dehydrogenase class IV
VEYCIFDRVENNPSLENVKEGGNEAARFNADL